MVEPKTVSLSELVPDPENARLHSEENLAAIERSLLDLGAGRSLLVTREGQVVAGNATLEAARRAGYTQLLLVPTDGKTLVAVQRTDLQAGSAEARVLGVADNRTAELGAWDHERLAGILSEGIELVPYGFAQGALQELLGKVDELNPLILGDEETPELPGPESTWVEPDDLLLLGPHALLCGDCCDDEVISTVLAAVEPDPGERKAALCFADPPYGISFRSKMRAKATRFKKIAGDGDGVSGAPTGWLDLLPLFMAADSALYCCTRWDVYPAWAELVSAVPGLVLKNCIVWDKGGGGLGDLEGDYSPEHEFLLFSVFGRHLLRGVRTSNVWSIGKPSVNAYRHPTQKPVDLIATAMLKSSSHQQIVLDPFCGSGTSLVAGHGLKRRVAAIELDPAYCQVALERWQAEAGMGATVVRDGRSWEAKELRDRAEFS